MSFTRLEAPLPYSYTHTEMCRRILFIDGVISDVPETLLHSPLLFIELPLSLGQPLSPVSQLIQFLHGVHHIHHLTGSTGHTGEGEGGEGRGGGKGVRGGGGKNRQCKEEGIYKANPTDTAYHYTLGSGVKLRVVWCWTGLPHYSVLKLIPTTHTTLSEYVLHYVFTTKQIIVSQ